jgi:putative component of toxin-antitoxin plasmid stabilization module
MAWSFFDYAELTGRNKIREWLDGLADDAARAAIDFRLLTMAAMPSWPEGWVSKYRGVSDLYEFRISANRVKYRPLGTYFGQKRYLILAGAIEKNDKIPKWDLETACARLEKVRKNEGCAVPHEFDSSDDLEADAE